MEITPTLVINQILFGLALGAVYILMACGLTIIFGLLDVVNFAHGTFYMLGAFAAFVIVIGCAPRKLSAISRMSSPRSRSGGTWIVTTARRK